MFRQRPTLTGEPLADVPRQSLRVVALSCPCLLYTSDAADERSSVDLGGRRIIKKKKHTVEEVRHSLTEV